MPDRDLVRKTKIEIFRAVLELDPKAPVVGELAEALLEDGRFEEAARTAREGITFHPDMLTCRVVLAEALEGLGRKDEARTAADSARVKADQANSSLIRLARLEKKLTSVHADEDTSEGPSPVDIPSPTLAALYLRQGDKEAAVRVYRRLLDQDPDNQAIRDKLNSILDRTEVPPKTADGKTRLLGVLERWLAASRLRTAGSLS